MKSELSRHGYRRNNRRKVTSLPREVFSGDRTVININSIIILTRLILGKNEHPREITKTYKYLSFERLSINGECLIDQFLKSKTPLYFERDHIRERSIRSRPLDSDHSRFRTDGHIYSENSFKI